jgi:hypothetical protein
VARAQLLVGDDACELEPELPPLALGRVRLRGRWQERVRRTDTVALEHEEPCLGAVVDGAGAGDPGQLGPTQIGAEGERHQDPADGARQAFDSSAEQVVDRVGNRDLVADRRHPLLDERTAELEREQRVSRRRLEHPAGHVQGEHLRETLGQETPRRAEAERADVHSLQTPCLERALEGPGVARSPREEEPDRVGVEPPRGEGQRVCGWSIEPLDVVDRDHEGRIRGKRAQGVQHTDRDGVRLGADACRLGPEEGHVQGVQLRRRQAAYLFELDVVEEVDQRRERELRLGAARPGREHTKPPRPRFLDTGLPERRLADAGPADEDEAAPGGVVGERAEHGKLRPAADHTRAAVSRRPVHKSPRPSRLTAPR